MGHKASSQHTGAVGRSTPMTARETERIADAAVKSRVQELCQQHDAAAVETLVEIMRNKQAAPGHRISAAKALLEYGHGKPQTTESKGGGSGITLVINANERREISVNGRQETLDV